jgi:hypothetical protein
VVPETAISALFSADDAGEINANYIRHTRYSSWNSNSGTRTSS